MKIQIQQRDLLNHISIAQKAVSTKTNISFHELIYFEAKDNKLNLYSTDGEISIITSVDCFVEEEGDMAIAANVINNIIRKLPNDEVKIDCTDGKINIKCLKSNFNIIAFEYYEKENLKEFSGDHLTIDNHILKETISETEFACSNDETKIALTGIYLECKNHYISFVALDGYRVALKNIKSEYPQSMKDLEVIVPKRAMIEFSRIIDENSYTEIYKLENDLVFVTDDTIMYTRIIDKNYIDFKNFMVDNSKIQVIADRVDLIHALERASLLADSQNANLIKLEIASGDIIIKSNSQLGDVMEMVKVEQKGEDLKIAFNARYLLEGIKAIKTDKIILAFHSTLNPCLLYPHYKEGEEQENTYTYMALPVRVAGEN